MNMETRAQLSSSARNLQRGMTLIEIMVVVAIIGTVMAAVAFVVFSILMPILEMNEWIS